MNNLKCLSGSQLKVFAIIIMTIDHVGATIFPQYIILRYIGRLAFPIFAFLIVEGMVYTHDSNKYLLRLAAFALISEIPFNLAFYQRVSYWGAQNIFFTLLIGGVCISIYQKAKNQWFGFLFLYFLSLSADLFQTDYGTVGVWLIFALYIVRGDLIKTAIVLIIVNACLFGGIQIYAIFAIIPICLYNGKRGFGMKQFFYGYYPVHLLILYLIAAYV